MISDRKNDHVRNALAQQHQPSQGNDFDAVTFRHHALAGVDRDEIDLTTNVAGLHWPVPLSINAMTGGSERTGEINRQLAAAAADTGVT